MDSTTRNLTQTITDLATPLAASLGLAIWGVEVVPAGRCVIRVFAESLEAFAEDRPIVAGDLGVADSVDGRPEEAPQGAMGLERQEQENSGQAGFEQADLSQAEISQGGISVDQCAELSRLLGLALEVEDCVESAYVLEVSSPGLNRLFFKPEQLQRAIGVKVEASLAMALPDFPARKKYIGTVARVEGDVCTLSVAEPEDMCVEIPWTAIKKIRQVYVMPEKKLPGKSIKNTRQKKSAAKKKK